MVCLRSRRNRRYLVPSAHRYEAAQVRLTRGTRMSNTYGGWNPQDPYRAAGPTPEGPAGTGREPPRAAGTAGAATRTGRNPSRRHPAPFDPYGPRDPYGRPANPYGRPDYQPQQQPEQRDPQPGVWGQSQRGQDRAPRIPAATGSAQATDPAALGPAAVPGAARPARVPAVLRRSPGAEHRPDDAERLTVGGAWRWAWSAFGASWGIWVLMSLLLGMAQLAVILVFSPSTMDGLMNADGPGGGRRRTGRGPDARGQGARRRRHGGLLPAAGAPVRRARSRRRGPARSASATSSRCAVSAASSGTRWSPGRSGSSAPSCPWSACWCRSSSRCSCSRCRSCCSRGSASARRSPAAIGLVLSHFGTALAVFGDLRRAGRRVGLHVRDRARRRGARDAAGGGISRPAVDGELRAGTDHLVTTRQFHMRRCGEEVKVGLGPLTSQGESHE